MHSDHSSYLKFTSRSRLEKSINSLIGLAEGITIDQEINEKELTFLDFWLKDHDDVKDLHPYNELVPLIKNAVFDRILTIEEHADIVWLCERLTSDEYFDHVTIDLQRLHAIVGGIGSDGKISESELKGLASWLSNHNHLKSCWPYDELDTLITTILKDKKIDDQEHSLLKEFFGEFVNILDDKTITSPLVLENGSLVGLCAVCPEIIFEGSMFCFTGASSRYTRSSLISVVEKFGGEVATSISKKINYLIIGADGNPCWAYACYGRKVEKAVELRRSGARILIVHENDFHDAIADMGA